MKNKSNFFRLSVFCFSSLLFILLMIYLNRTPGWSFMTVSDYLQKSINPNNLQNVLKRQGDFLLNELIDLRQKLGEDYVGIPADTLRRQRNDMSKILNEVKQRVGKLDCEKTKEKVTKQAGGFCQNASREIGGDHLTDMSLIQALSKFFKGKTVGSFGDGPGAYKRELEKLGDVKLYDAYDGAPFCEETSEGRVKFLDLTIPQYSLPIYDWIISLEVAEHIPRKFEAIYIDNLVRHSREGIVLSWAVIGQDGLAHVNNRPPEHPIKVMEEQGFGFDFKESERLRSVSTFEWFQRNINVYYRKEAKYVDYIESWFS